jgi:hypothetical protein
MMLHHYYDDGETHWGLWVVMVVALALRVGV